MADEGRKKLAAHKQIVSMTKVLMINNLPADRVDAFRWLFHADTQMPGQISKDVIDITDGAQPGVHIVKHVHCSDKQTQILNALCHFDPVSPWQKDVLTSPILACESGCCILPRALGTE